MRADIGIALDGDADRVIIVDEKGHIVDGDQIMAVIAESWHQRGQLTGGGVVATVMSNLGLERYLKEHRSGLVRTPVGDRYVIEHMRKHGFNVGGEQSGHIILSDFTTTGDGLVAALQVAVGGGAERQAGERGLQALRAVAASAEERAATRTAVSRSTRGGAAGDRRRQVEARQIGPAGHPPVRHRAVIRVMAEGDDEKLVKTVVSDIVHALTDAAA